MRPLETRNRIVGVPVHEISIDFRGAAAVSRRRSHAGRAAPRPRGLIGDSVLRPHGQLGLHRVVVGTIGIVPHLHDPKLRIGRDEVLWEQSAGPHRPARDGLACGDSDADICRIQRVCHISEIAIGDVRPERRVPAQRFRACDIAAHNADAGAEIQAVEHLVKHRRVPAGLRDGQCLQQPVVLEIGFIVVDR